LKKKLNEKQVFFFNETPFSMKLGYREFSTRKFMGGILSNDGFVVMEGDFTQGELSNQELNYKTIFLTKTREELNIET